MPHPVERTIKKAAEDVASLLKSVLFDGYADLYGEDVALDRCKAALSSARLHFSNWG